MFLVTAGGFQRCRMSDPKFDECLNEAIQQAMDLIGHKGMFSFTSNQFSIIRVMY